MSKKSKPHTRSGTTKTISFFKNYYKKIGKNGLIILLLFTVATSFLAAKQLAIYREKSMYNQAELQITQFIDEVAGLAPSTKEIRKYCSYSSAKYSKGDLGCDISGEVQYVGLTASDVEAILLEADSYQKKLKWEFGFDNTRGNKELYPNIILQKVYSYKQLTCSVSYNYASDEFDGDPYDSTGLLVRSSCSGSAMREYY